jgi:hypothetical protein
VLTRHARERLVHRGVSKEDIILTIQKPIHKERLFDEGNKWAFRRKIRGKTLEVVLFWLRDENTFIVKTAYFT